MSRDELCEAFPGRAKQIDQILGFMGKPWSPTPPSLLINGNSSLGKTALVKTILSTQLGQKSPSRYAFLDCVECHTPRLIFEHILHQLTHAPKERPTTATQFGHKCLDTVPKNTKAVSLPRDNSLKKRQQSAPTTDEPWEKCESVNEFVESCRRICNQGDNPQTTGTEEKGRPKGQRDTRYIVLDRAERLRDTAPSLVPVLMRLQELTGQNICVILITTIVWEKFRSKTGGFEPIILNFPQYSKDETIAILERDLPQGEDAELYQRFIHLVYDVFQRNCKDLNEVRHLAALLFPLYVKPVKEGKIQKHEGLKLHRSIQAYFVEAMDKLYLREISSMEWSDRTLASSGTPHTNPLDHDNMTRMDSHRRWMTGAPGSEQAMMAAVDVQNIFDLPYYTKFILFASFLASYNPPRLDMRYFAKVSNQGGKMTKRAKISAAKKHGQDQQGSKLRQQLLGPKTFPIERMLAIFYSILNEEVEENVHVHTQIASLISLRLLQRITPMDKLDSIKCKCNISYDMVKAMAKSTKFDIDKYLYNFT